MSTADFLDEGFDLLFSTLDGEVAELEIADGVTRAEAAAGIFVGTVTTVSVRMVREESGGKPEMEDPPPGGGFNSGVRASSRRPREGEVWLVAGAPGASTRPPIRVGVWLKRGGVTRHRVLQVLGEGLRTVRVTLSPGERGVA